MLSEKDRKRFWSRVFKQSGDRCWVWLGCTYGWGYGHIKIGGKARPVHIVSYEDLFGSIPQGALVLHTCDNPLCVRPDHLFLGTHAINMADRDAKNRNAKGIMIGNSEVIEMRFLRTMGWTIRRLAKRYSISHTQANAIVRRLQWKHLS